jgi:uncharacterized membrane protein YphA (DoxX/SURF4 family)
VRGASLRPPLRWFRVAGLRSFPAPAWLGPFRHLSGEVSALAPFKRWGPLVARVCIALVFLYSGQDKLQHRQDSIADVRVIGLPTPVLFTWATIVTQLGGGLALALDIFAAWGALVLAGFTALATILGHRYWLLKGAEARHEFTTVLEHLAIIGGLLLVMVEGLRP